MTAPQGPPPIIVVAHGIVASLMMLTSAVGAPVTLVGGWAVAARLHMARLKGRPTEDLDVLLSAAARPAAVALRAINAVQEDQTHPCRVTGLPLLVDLLADTTSDAVAATGNEELIVDEDGLRLLVPPMADLLVRASEQVWLESRAADATRVSVRLPNAGALFAAKVANIALEFREPHKRASDAEDAVRLLFAFGAGAILTDLRIAHADERIRVQALLEQIAATGFAAQARANGYVANETRLAAGIQRIVVELAPETAVGRTPS